jgi:hypothetical protein
VSTLSLQGPVGDRGVTKGKTVGTVLTVVVAGLFALIALVVQGSTNTRIAYGSVALFLIGLTAAITMSNDHGLRRSLAMGQLGPFFGVSTAVTFGLASLIWLSAPRADQALLIAPDSILVAMVVAWVAIACFAIGYVAAPRMLMRRVTSIRRLVGIHKTVIPRQRAAWMLLGIALAGYAAQVANGSFGYLSDPAAQVSAGNPISNLLYLIGTFSVFATAVAANDWARRRGRWRFVSFVLILAVQTVAGALSGNKEVVVLGFVASLFGYATAAHSFPVAAAVGAAVAFVFIVVPFNVAYRNVINVGSSRLSLLQVAQDAYQQGPGYFLASVGSGGGLSPWELTIQRVSRIGDVAIIVQTTPSVIPDRPMSELVEAPVLGFIPRALWPGKPILSTGYQFSQDYYLLPAYVYTSNAVTPEGDLWRHGGWVVLVGGMLIFGACIRVLDAATENPSAVPLRLFLVLSFFSIVVKQEMDMVSLLASVPSLLFGVAVATRLVRWSTAREPQQTGLLGASIQDGGQ